MGLEHDHLLVLGICAGPAFPLPGLRQTVIQANWTHPFNLSALLALLPALYVLLHSTRLPNLANGVFRYYPSREACHLSLDIHLYFNRDSGRPNSF